MEYQKKRILVEEFDIGDVSQGQFFQGYLYGSVTVQVPVRNVNLAETYGDPLPGAVPGTEYVLEDATIEDYELYLTKVDQDGGDHDSGIFDPNKEQLAGLLAWAKGQV